MTADVNPISDGATLRQAQTALTEQRIVAAATASSPRKARGLLSRAGGEVKTARGGTAIVKGSVASRGAGPVASR